MDYATIFIFTLIAATFILQCYNQYFARGAKISDSQLMQNYVMLNMKRDHRNYYPPMKITKENY